MNARARRTPFHFNGNGGKGQWEFGAMASDAVRGPNPPDSGDSRAD